MHLAKNPTELESKKLKLAENRLKEPLFDTPRFTRNLERLYKQMWNNYLDGAPARQIKVAEP